MPSYPLYQKEHSLPPEINLNSNLHKLLRKFDTPTICNAIEVAQGKRGFNNFTRGTMISSSPKNPPIVGFARTAKIAALEPSNEPVDIIKKRRMDYYEYMSNSRLPSLAVIEDMDFPDCIGAYWGEINTSIHKSFGMAGALTNGVMRDLGDLPSGFPVIAKSIGPSHGFVHVREINVDVDICGLKVSPGNLVHADQHGAVVIPNEILNTLDASIEKLIKSEKIILDETKKGSLNFENFSKAWEAFERSRT